MEILMPEPQIYVERTLAIIKPDVIDKEEEIEDLILRSGFHIIQKRKLQLSPEQCSNFYGEQFGKVFFPNLTAYMSSGPIVAMVLARNCAVSYWKELLGPSNSLRARRTHPHSNLGACSHWTKSSGLPEPVCEAHAAGWAHCPVQREASRPHVCFSEKKALKLTWGVPINYVIYMRPHLRYFDCSSFITSTLSVSGTVTIEI
ncbi:nucleoside diphosphate kinase homolog 5 isoform X4 [Corvus moneduloides]|uniref:nucleoside diphosphate kinase homolog 5 isoform X4 n=1 Tax=Corvus moneduloides TaxID=1196302 RepID=UPI001362855D|nr:nucleoside diphosphate kinase homolog 5 isoform X4 [Corvus moneduloides]